MQKFLYIFIIIFSLQLQAQEFKANVSINAAGVRGSNKHVFKTLEHALETFVNNTRWTDKRFKDHEKIKVDLMLNVKNYDIKTNEITAELYFRSYRPVYHSDYETLLLNLIEKDFVFKYREFEKLDFNLELFESNLTSTIAFYLYVALGHDFDSFKENAGKDFFEKAAIIQNNAEQNSIKGWSKDHKNNSKGDLIELLLDNNSYFYHKTIFTYHRWGLDLMADKLVTGKNNIISAINYLTKLKQNNPNADYLIRIFFDAKADEIVQIFTSGPPVNTRFVVSKLRNLAPYYDHKWDEIEKNGTPGTPTRRIPPRAKEGTHPEKSEKINPKKPINRYNPQRK